MNQPNFKATQTPRDMLHLPISHETRRHKAQQPLHNCEGMPVCVAREHSLHQGLLSTKLEFCWSSASPNHCLKAADETGKSPKTGVMDGRQESTGCDSHNSPQYLKKLKREKSSTVGVLSLFLRNNRADASRHSRMCCQFRAWAAQGGLNSYSGALA